MAEATFDLKDLQDAVVGVPKDLILPEDHNNSVRDVKQQSIRKIVDLYSTCRNNKRVYKSTYDALKDDNPFVRVAAADLISTSGTQNSFDYLFKALEDEDNMRVKQEIVRAINVLEARINNKTYDEGETKVSFMKSMKILSQA